MRVYDAADNYNFFAFVWFAAGGSFDLDNMTGRWIS